MELPNYQVFDEKRYFAPARSPACSTSRRQRRPDHLRGYLGGGAARRWRRPRGAQLLLNINSSPYHRGKRAERWDRGASRQRPAMPAAHRLCQPGGRPGRAGVRRRFVRGRAATARWPRCRAAFRGRPAAPGAHSARDAPAHSRGLPGASAAEETCDDHLAALVLVCATTSTRTASGAWCWGCRAASIRRSRWRWRWRRSGRRRVEAVMMPFRYTAEMSVEDAAGSGRDARRRAQGDLDRDRIYEAFMASLAQEFAGRAGRHHRGEPAGPLPRRAVDVDLQQEGPPGADHRQQERDGGGLLHALRRHGRRLRRAQGRAEDAGVRAGRYRNSLGPCIPAAGDRPPALGGAGARPEGRGYAAALRACSIGFWTLYVERDFSADDDHRDRYGPEQVRRVLRLVDINEYKRRQAPIGVRITRRGFGRDRRYPMTSGWAPGDRSVDWLWTGFVGPNYRCACGQVVRSPTHQTATPRGVVEQAAGHRTVAWLDHQERCMLAIERCLRRARTREEFAVPVQRGMIGVVAASTAMVSGPGPS